MDPLTGTQDRRTGDGSNGWFALAAGAFTSVGISLTLTTFGAAIGLSVISTTPSWRDASSALWFCSGLYLVFVALLSFGLGGYVAGRIRRVSLYESEETAYRDGLYGVATWGLALLLSAILAGFLAWTAKPQVQQSAAPASTTAETLLASELDNLFRDSRRPGEAAFDYHRTEAGRLLLQAASKRGLSSDDRDYLTAIVVTETGIEPELASRRLDKAVADSRNAVHQARMAAVLQAFMVAIGLALGAAISAFSAIEGGKERDRGHVPVWNWSLRRPV